MPAQRHDADRLRVAGPALLRPGDRSALLDVACLRWATYTGAQPISKETAVALLRLQPSASRKRIAWKYAMSKTAARILLARQHEEQALELRLGGATYAQIAEALGMTSGGAYKAVARAMERTRKEADEKAEELRRIEYLRLERMHMGLWPRAKAGDEKAVHDRAGYHKAPQRAARSGSQAAARARQTDLRSSAVRTLGAAQIATAMDETLQRYQAGRIDADQAHHELEILKGQLKAAELTVLEEKLARIEAALERRP